MISIDGFVDGENLYVLRIRIGNSQICYTEQPQIQRTLLPHDGK
jgi:hypothetical protein